MTFDRWLRATLVTIALLGGSPQVGAAAGQATSDASAATLALTLDDAIARSLEASHRVAELEALGQAAAASVDASRAADRPFVTLLGDYQRTNHIDEFGVVLPTGERQIIFPDLPNNYRARLDLRWPIYSGGRVDALERAAAAERDARLGEIASGRNDLRLEVTRAYWALVTAGEAVRVLDGAVARMDAQLRDVNNFLAVGLIPPNEVLAVEAERSRQEVLRIEAENQRAVAEADLARLVGLPVGSRVSTLSQLAAASTPEPPPLGALLIEAADSRPDRRAIANRLDSMAASRDAAAAELRPLVSVGGGVDYARPNPRFLPRRDLWQHSWDASVNLSWRLWDGGRTRAAVAESEAAGRAMAERLREFDSRLVFDVQRHVLELHGARAAVPAATAMVRSAEEARRVVSDRFAAGVATSTDALDAQVRLLEAELGLTRARASARLAEARLERAIGR